MIRKIIMLLLIALCILQVVSAINETNSSEEIWNYITEELGVEEGDTLPDYLPYDNERTNFYTPEEEFIGHIVTEDGVITSISDDVEIEDSTMNLVVEDVDSVKEIAESDKPMKEFNEKLQNDEIEIVGTTTGSKVKNWFMEIVVWIMSWF